MKQHGAKSENHERKRMKQDTISGGGAFGFITGSKIPFSVLVNSVRRNGEHGRGGQGGKDGDHEKDGALRESVADCAGQKRNYDVAAVVEGRIPAYPPRQLVSRHQTKSQRRDSGSEDIARNREHAQGKRHRPESWSDKDNGGGHGHGRHG